MRGVINYRSGTRCSGKLSINIWSYDICPKGKSLIYRVSGASATGKFCGRGRKGGRSFLRISFQPPLSWLSPAQSLPHLKMQSCSPLPRAAGPTSPPVLLPGDFFSLQRFDAVTHRVVNCILTVQAEKYLKLPNVPCSQLTNADGGNSYSWLSKGLGQVSLQNQRENLQHHRVHHKLHCRQLMSCK